MYFWLVQPSNSNYLLSQIGSSNGEAILSSWPSSAGPVDQVLSSLLDYLDKQGLSKAQAEIVGATPLIPVLNATSLAPPKSLFLRLPLDLSPFAFEMPAAFSSRLVLLKTLGVQDEISIEVSGEICPL